MDAVTPVNPSAVVPNPTDDECPGREATALSIGPLPAPELRTAALLALLRTEVTRRSGKEHIRWPPLSVSP